MTSLVASNHMYNHLPVGHPDNPKTWAVCGSKTRQETSNPLCLRPAGWGTSHPGKGRCKLHGGANLIGPAHHQYKSGRYAHAFNAELAQHWQQIAESDDDPLDLLPELQATQAIFAYHLAHVFDQPKPGKKQDLNGTLSLRTLNATADTGHELVDNETNADDAEENENPVSVGVGESGDSQMSVRLVPYAPTPRPEFSSIPAGIDPAVVQARFEFIADLGEKITNTVAKVIAARNSTAITKVELMWLQKGMTELINEFIPEADRRRAFLARLRELLPGRARGEPAEGDSGAEE